jgi:MFS family permease
MRRDATARPAAGPGVGWATLGTVSLGYLLVSWGMAPISAILPTISADLGIDVAAAGWVMNSYFLLLVGTILIMGRIGDLFGHRRVFACGILVFGLAAGAAGLTSHLEPLVVARAIQGIGSSMVFATSLALVAEAVPNARRGLAIGILTMSSGAASLLGVAFSAYAAENLTWHWAFFVPIPVAAVALLFAWRLPAGQRSGSPALIDWQGGILLFAGLTVLMLSLAHFHEGEESFQQGAHYHLPMHALALVLLAAFAWVESRVPQPLLQLGMLRDLRFASGVLGNGIAHMSMLASSFLLPFLLERGLGLFPSDTARLMVAMQACMLVCSLGAGWLYDRTRTPALGWATMGSIAGGLLLLGLVGAALPYAALVGIGALLGAGLGGFTTVNNTAVMGIAAPGKRGFASGMVETTRQLGHSVGVSMSSSIMAGALAGVAAPELPRAYAAGFEQAALAMGLVATVGLLAIILPSLPGRGAPEARHAPTGRPVAT